jgi:pyruvate kinase
MQTQFHEALSTDPALAPDVLDSLAHEVEQLRQQVIESEAEVASLLDAVHPDNRRSARNLVHYLALRRHDIRDLQMRLSRVGLSSIGRSEPHVLVTLDRIIALLALARGAPAPDTDIDTDRIGFREGDRILAGNAERLLGAAPANRSVRILVTLSTEAATDPQFTQDLLSAGMDCARINCARDDREQWTAMAKNVRAAQQCLGRECKILADLGGPKLRTSRIRRSRKSFRVFAGDRFELVRGESCACKGKRAPKRIGCTSAEVFDDAEPGQPIWFDDAKIGGVIERRTADGFLIQVTHVKPKGAKIRPDRGINLPETTLSLPALGEKDLADLDSVVQWADGIEMSFVQREEDVLALHAALRDRNAEHLGVILKIEKKRAFDELPRLLLAAMRAPSCGVMIARGDLAIETGFERMAEVQEEILWIAEAGHLPAIWATQVLESLAKEGMPSRAEMTDAAMSARAEAVMLNKGPFIVEAIKTLDDILGRMQDHQAKKRSLYSALHVSESLWGRASS